MKEENFDISTIPEEKRIRLFTEAWQQILAQSGFDLESFRAEFRRKFETPPEPLFFSTSPLTIKVGKLNGPLTEISLAEFEAQEKTTWSTSPLLGQEIRTEIFRNTNFPLGFNAAVAQIFRQEFPDFAICDINETAGKGLVFVPSARTPKLPAGSVVGIYTGVLSSSHTGKGFCPYGYHVKSLNDPNHPVVFDALKLGNEFFDAEKFRNFTSYVQHAPDEEALSKVKNLPDDIKPYIARSNVIASPTTHCGLNVLVLYAARDISGLLFLDYGTYFNGKSYQLFDHNGNVVGTVNENNEFEQNPQYIPDKNPPKIPKTLSAEQLQKTVTKNAHGAQDFLTLYLFEHAKFVIELYRRRAIPGTEQFLDAFIANLAKVKESGTLHDVIDSIVTIEKRLDPYPELEPLKNELICLLKMHCAYLEQLKKFKEQLQTEPQTCPKKWGVTKESWKLYAFKEKTHFGFLGRKTELRKASKDLAYLNPLIMNWGKQELLAIAVSVIFAREVEKQEKQLISTQKAQKK